MSPNEKSEKKLENMDCDGDKIVISGVSGKFPNSKNVNEFSENIYNKVNMMDDLETRWKHTNPEIPKNMGKISGLSKFDANFFGINPRQVHSMDPQCRMLMECAYEAVLDAGVNPKTLRNSRTGVFIGVCFVESEKSLIFDQVLVDGSGLTGCARSMLANRISSTMGLVGPSFIIDTACSSSLYAIDVAYQFMKNNECDTAIVGGSNLLLHPRMALQYSRLGVLAIDGCCRPFDENAKGFTRAEAISCVFLQRSRDAKRIYATVVHSKTNCDGYKEEGITFPSHKMQAKLMQSFYEDLKVSPTIIDYLEAHMTATHVGDPEECKSIDEILCKNRTTPLPTGSVKSNMGHSEAAAGVCSVVKAILAYHTGLIAPNINFEKPRPTIPALVEGRLKVITEPTPLEGPHIAINGFGFGGANAHLLLKGNLKPKINFGIPEDTMPRLVIWSGRTENACHQILDSVSKRPLDAEYVALMNNTQSNTVSANTYRGYGVYFNENSANAKCLTKEIQQNTETKRPLVWVFSGMGSQWNEMGTSLLQIPLFKATIDKLHAVLMKVGVNLNEIITSKDPKIFDNILHSFVGNAAIQVAMVDILRQINVKPDYIIGHSVGELGCAYADNCLTAEEMILCAYSRGMASIETEVIFGSMAAIGLGYREIRALLPPGIEVACRNSADSCTISGPAENVSKFVKELKSQGIFAKEVNTANIAYHSKYIAEMGPKLLPRLHKILKEPRFRSDKWLSTSVPKSKWGLLENQICSAEYQTNNLLNAVLFEETAALLPKNALLIEIAPHSLLQAILKKSMPSAVYINLAQRNNKQNVNVLFGGLGKIFLNGVDIQLNELYPAIEFPVSAGTPMISPHVEWDHSEDWCVIKYDDQNDSNKAERTVIVNLRSNEFEYVAGHIIDGRLLFPATAYLLLVWETFGMMLRKFYLHLAVEFQDVQFLRATNMQKNAEITFVVMIHRGTGRFEITENEIAVVTGIIKAVDNIELTEVPTKSNSSATLLASRDFYKELRIRGYHYNGEFKNVIEAQSDGLAGKVLWKLNFAAFMDCMLQTNIVGDDNRSLIIPTGIERIRINPTLHFEMATENPIFTVQSIKQLNIVKSGGIEFKGLRVNAVGRHKPPGYPVLEEYAFLPHFPSPRLSVEDAARVVVQIARENTHEFKFKTVEIASSNNSPIVQELHAALGDLPLITAESILLNSESNEDLLGVQIVQGELKNQTGCSFIIGTNLLANQEITNNALNSLKEHAFLVSRELETVDISSIQVPTNTKLVSVLPTIAEETWLMFQYQKKKRLVSPIVIKVSSSDVEYEWLEELKNANENEAIVVVAQNEPQSGILGLVNCIRAEPNGLRTSCVFIDDSSAPEFDINNTFYSKQLSLGLAINVYRDGQWGTYRHLHLELNQNVVPEYRQCYINALTKGDLSSLKWQERNPYSSASKDDLVQIQYASLNFRDVMLASGKLADDTLDGNRTTRQCLMGFEYAGIKITTGQRVMGMVKAGALATHIEGDPMFQWEVPSHWTMEQAATVPIVYLTVYLSFFFRARIQPGKKILIHAGTGGVGLAAIRVALCYGLEVFTTVSTEEKQEYLLKHFPQLKASHIGNSRDLSFFEMVMLETDGAGVDYVLNSLSEEKLIASVKCLGRGGQFLEIGKFDIMNDNKLGLNHFGYDLTFHAILLDLNNPIETKKALSSLVLRDIKSGVITPLKTNVFPAHQVEQAVRLLASGKHMGKVVLKVRENETDKHTLPILVLPRTYCDPNLTFIIAGGLGGFGLELADWLVIRGCRKLVLSSSQGITKPYQKYRISVWKSYGAEVVVSTSDITTRKGCFDLITEANRLGPVGGIFNLAVKLRDAILENQDAIKFNESLAVKSLATKYLDEVSQQLCPNLKHFVVFSSVSCGRGNAGQTNYGMANSIMERIMEQRKLKKLPAKAIQWGAVGEVGLVADMQEDKIDIEIGGTLQQRISSCLQELDVLLDSPATIVSSMVVAEKRNYGSGKGGILETVKELMGLRDIKSISVETKLSEIGMDSLMAVEIKQTLERNFEIFLTPQEVRSLTFAKLQELNDNQKVTEKLSQPVASATSDIETAMLFRNFGDETHCHETLLRVESANNLLNSKTAVVIVPGIEGVASEVYRRIAENLNFPTYILQLTHTIAADSSSEIVESILEELLEKAFDELASFYLVGYSFGSLLTLDLARLLESKGIRGKVVLIDGSPNFLKQLAYGHVLTVSGQIDEENIQTAILMTAVRSLFAGEEQETWNTVVAISGWDKRVAKIVELAKSKTIYSTEYCRKMLNALLKRIKIAMSYNENQTPIASDIVLIRATETAITDIDEDYGLTACTTGQMTLTYLQGNHSTMLDNLKVSEIINGHDPYKRSERISTDFVKG